MDSTSGLVLAVTVILGIVHGLVLSAVLCVNKKGDRTANRLLSVLILVLVWHHLQSISIFLGFYQSFPHFFGADHGSLFLFGPLFYFYTRKVTDPAYIFRPIHLAHFLPFVIVTLYDPVLLLGTEAKIDAINLWLNTMRYDNPELASKFFVSNVLFLIEFVHVMIYVSFSIRLHRILKGAKSSLKQIHFHWLRKLTLGFGVVLLISFLLQRVLYIVIHYYSYSFDYVYIVPMTVFIYAIGIVAMRQPEIYYGLVDVRGGRKKYESSSLSSSDIEAYGAALLRHMKQDRPYLKPNLKLADVAAHLSIHPNHLSQVINERFEQPFLTFINTYRIEVAKQILADPKATERTILQIAYEVGFNNKASFNAEFKKQTMTTPTAFRRAGETD